MSDTRDRMARAREAVEAAYGESLPDADQAPDQQNGEPAVEEPPVPATGPDGDLDAAALLTRAHAVALGAPQEARQQSPVLRRVLKSLLGRLIRFETAWQHEFNQTLVNVADRLSQRLDEVDSTLQATQARVAEADISSGVMAGTVPLASASNCFSALSSRYRE